MYSARSLSFVVCLLLTVVSSGCNVEVATSSTTTEPAAHVGAAPSFAISRTEIAAEQANPPVQTKAHLPAPPEATRLQSADPTKQLSFDVKEAPDEVAAYYRKTLAADGWKATTEKLITIDRKLIMIFRNPQQDMLTLELTTVDAVTHGTLKHDTSAEVADTERRLSEAAKRKKAEAKSTAPTP